MQRRTITAIIGMALLSAIASAEAAPLDTRFDLNGNLTPQASIQFFQKIKPSLREAVSDERYLSEPFPEMFMSTGYFRKDGDIMMFVNPTFGMLVIFVTPTSRPYAVGVTELFKLVGAPPDVKPNNISARYIYFTKYIDLYLKTYRNFPLVMIDDLKDLGRNRDVNSNRLFISEPIMRAANPDVKSCYAVFPHERYNRKINEKLENESKNKTPLSFEPVDLVPLANDEGLLILSEQSLRSFYAFVPIKRYAGLCTFGEPKYGIHEWW